MTHAIKRLLFGAPAKVYPPIKAGEHIAAMPPQRPTFNEWSENIRVQLNQLKYGSR